MSELPALPPRPDPPRHLVDTLRAWLAWFGPARLIASALAVAVVVAGGAWLVRAPAPAPEAGLPVATAAEPTITLPPPGSTAVDSTSPATVIVHVAGAVRRPGVHELATWARVHTAIDAAGGATPDADLDGLNLASPLADGQRIYVPVAGEVDPASVPTWVPGADVPVTDPGPLDLNRAGAADFEALPGVGPATAAAIIDDRARNGPFASVDDLDRVPGIGPAKLAALRDLVTV
jgi:competence protein ComEA